MLVFRSHVAGPAKRKHLSDEEFIRAIGSSPVEYEAIQFYLQPDESTGDGPGDIAEEERVHAEGFLKLLKEPAAP